MPLNENEIKSNSSPCHIEQYLYMGTSHTLCTCELATWACHAIKAIGVSMNRFHITTIICYTLANILVIFLENTLIAKNRANYRATF